MGRKSKKQKEAEAIEAQMKTNQISSGDDDPPRVVAEPVPANRKRGKTDELPGMPKPDGVGLAAQNFRTTIEKIDTLIEEKGENEMALFKALKKARRASIQIDGYKFDIQHTGPKDKIKITKPK